MASARRKNRIDQMRERVSEFRPGKASNYPARVTFPDRLFIGLFGRTGCGKTSLINSMKFAAAGALRRAKWLQVASQEKQGGHTMYRKVANLTKSIYLIDNRGLDDPDTDRAIEELSAQLDGKRGYGQRVEWQAEDQGIDLSDRDLNGMGHTVNCAVFVFSAHHDIDTNMNGLADVVDFIHGHQGRYPVAVITHVDVVGEAMVENLEALLQTAGMSAIFKVANITDRKRQLEEEYQLNLLSLVERCMIDGDDTFVFKHYQEMEAQRRVAVASRRRDEMDTIRREMEVISGLEDMSLVLEQEQLWEIVRDGRT